METKRITKGSGQYTIGRLISIVIAVDIVPDERAISGAFGRHILGPSKADDYSVEEIACRISKDIITLFDRGIDPPPNWRRLTQNDKALLEVEVAEYLKPKVYFIKATLEELSCA